MNAIHEEKQRIFTATVLHARKQRRQSLRKVKYLHETPCSYRGDGGLSCFAGCHIKDEFYDKTMEGQSCYDQNVKAALFNSGIPNNPEVIFFIKHLQNIHDNYETDHWEEGFRNTAGYNDLLIPKPTPELPLL